ncbi:MAG: helix-turn-helix transcriptional regulator [Dysgonamonadaceae bacterium]|jgi:AraC-like DNA-binding protein|nr:helix-turn-helix transcriptional regulator [Dysgonamonadaceae bacterium]
MISLSMFANDFFIAFIEKDKDILQSLASPHRNYGNELFLPISGHMIRNCNFNNIRLNSKDIHLSLSRQISFVSGFSQDVKGYYCCFGDAFMAEIHLKENLENDLEFIASFLFHYPLRLDDAVFKRIGYLFEILLGLNNISEQDKSLIQIYLIAIIYEIKKMMIESGLDFYPSKAFLITKKYNDLLAANVSKERSVEFYAGQLGISPNHLNKSVKAVTGRTAITILNEMNLQEAKMQLKYTNLSVGEIAFQLGFEDLSYFSRFFKKATGLSPLEYRKVPPVRI